MLKPRKFDIEDSNIANIGTKMDKELRKSASDKEPAWEKAGKVPGIEIWRVEKFQIKEWPKEQYGHFYTGDSYIVLKTNKDPESGKLKWDVHFWIGNNSTQDEYGTAAYKTVELDDHLGGEPVQHREIQDYESALFLTYFKEIHFHEGGIETGFKHVTAKEYKPRLLHVKGAKSIIIREVPLAASSLNSGDVFIYDGGLDILVLQGKDCNAKERSRSAEFVSALVSDRGHAKHHVYAESDSDAKPFWDAVGGKPAGGINPAIPDTPVKSEKKLFKLSDETGKMEMKQVTPVALSTLQQDDAYILDAGSEIFVWVGKGASKDEKSKALGYATDYLFKNNRPKALPISRIVQGGENEYFKKAFE